MAREFVEVRVHGVAVDGGDGLPTVFLQECGGMAGMGLQVGPFEASAIIIELEGIVPPRPLTHDLLADLFKESGARLLRVEVFGASARDPRARLVYARGLRRRAKEVRPSDALALALRLKTPLYVASGLMDGLALASGCPTALAPEEEGYYLKAAGGLG